jgi:hypothetical protein
LEARVGSEPTYKGFADSLNFIILWARLAFTDVLVAAFDRFSGLVVSHFGPLKLRVIGEVASPGCAAGNVPKGLTLPYCLELHHSAAWLGAFLS